MAVRSAEILLVEDNPADARFTQIAMVNLGMANDVTVLTDGEQALSYLLDRGKSPDKRLPDVILLDWNLPKVEGSEVLELIRQHERLRNIPVAILTGSRAEIDVLQAYHLRADCYLTKPVDIIGFITLVQSCPSLRLNLVVDSEPHS